MEKIRVDGLGLFINIKQLQEQAGIKSLEKLAAEVGCTQATLYNLANGRSNTIRFDILTNLCSRLNCTPGDLLEVEKVPAEASAKRLMLELETFPDYGPSAAPKKAPAKGARGRAGK